MALAGTGTIKRSPSSASPCKLSNTWPVRLSTSRTLLSSWRRFDLSNRLHDPDRTEQLHRARGHADGTRRDRGARMALDQQRGYAVPGEDEGSGQADQAASKDQERRGLVIQRWAFKCIAQGVYIRPAAC